MAMPTDRQSPYKILEKRDFPSKGIKFAPGPALALKALSCLPGSRRPVTAETADGGSCFRLRVSRFNGLQRRCSCTNTRTRTPCLNRMNGTQS
jgi:hypothetical protein